MGALFGAQEVLIRWLAGVCILDMRCSKSLTYLVSWHGSHLLSRTRQTSSGMKYAGVFAMDFDFDV